MYEAAKRVQDSKGSLTKSDVEAKFKQLREEDNNLWEQAKKLVEKSEGDPSNKSLVAKEFDKLKQFRVWLWVQATYHVDNPKLVEIEAKYAELVKEYEQRKPESAKTKILSFDNAWEDE